MNYDWYEVPHGHWRGGQESSKGVDHFAFLSIPNDNDNLFHKLCSGSDSISVDCKGWYPEKHEVFLC